MKRLFILIAAIAFACGAMWLMRPSENSGEEKNTEHKGGGVMIETLVQKFLYYPVKLEQDAKPPYYVKDAEEVWMKAADGNRIHGLYWPATANRPTILFFHGNAQSVFEWALIREDFAELDCGLLLIDYPGYGKSSGSPGEEALYAAGKAAYSWLTEEQKVPEGMVLLFGKSLGGGVATEMARGKKVLGLVLESTFRSIPSVAEKLLPMIPTGSLFASERYTSVEKLPEVHAPVMVIHGTDDDLIQVEEGKGLYEKAGNPKWIYLVEGAGHNDVSMVAGAAYGTTLRKWLDQIMPK